VSNIAPSITEQNLLDFFGVVGPVESLVRTDLPNGGRAYTVRFKEEETGTQAFGLNGTVIDNVALTIEGVPVC